MTTYGSIVDDVADERSVDEARRSSILRWHAQN